MNLIDSKRILHSWIISAGDIFLSVIVSDEIPITSIPPVQMTALYASLKEPEMEYVEKLKRKTLQATYSELTTSVPYRISDVGKYVCHSEICF